MISIKDIKNPGKYGISLQESLLSLIQHKHFEERRLFLYGAVSSSCEYTESVLAYTSDFPLFSAPDITRFIVDFNREDDIEEETARLEGKSFERKPIWLYIDSIGGDVIEGFSLASAIELSKTPVYTVNIGDWASVALIVGAAGHKRYTLPYSRFMMHDGFDFIVGTSAKVQDAAKFNEKFETRIVKQFILRHTNPDKMTSDFYDAIYMHDFYMLPEEALNYGFVDEIIDDLSILK